MAIKDLYPSIAPSLSLDFANVKALDSRITFARASTGAYYDGVTHAKAEENLLIRSQELNTAASWGTSNATVSANTAETTAPDGTSTAEKLLETAVTNNHIIFQGGVPYVSGLPYTFSVFAKKAERNFVVLQLPSGAFGSDTRAFFNLDTGAVGTTVNSPTTSITAAGNGWYRCSITKTATLSATPNNVIYVAETDGTTSYLGDITKGIYLWGAQLEQRSSVTSYTATTTQPITNYIPVLQTAPANTARFDHDPVTGESLGLLVEEQRTNLFTYSEDFSNVIWVKNRGSVISNTMVAPDGTLTGDKYVEDTTAGLHAFRNQSYTYLSSTSYSFSCYVKKAGRNFFRANSFVSGVGGVTIYVNLDTGATTTSNSNWTIISTSAKNVGNGVYRCSISFTTTTGGGGYVDIGPTTGSGADSYQGNGYSGIYIWGAQLEAGAFPTSYIKTEASQVTRASDAASMTGANFSSWYRADEGTLYAEAQTVELLSSAKGVFAIGNPTLAFANRTKMDLFFNNGNSGRIGYLVNVNGVSQASLTNSYTQLTNTFTKVAASYKQDDFGASTNGLTTQQGSSGNIPVVTSASIGSLNSSWSGGGNYLNGHIRKLSYYPARLTNTQLQALTS